MKVNQSNLFNLFELVILLILPLPFLHLNVWYVLLGIGITLLSKYLRKESWRDYGFRSIERRKFFVALSIGLIFGLLDTYFLEPYVSESLTGKGPDLSSFEGIQGNLPKFLIYLVLAWLIGGFFEEYFFRAYLFHRFKQVLNNHNYYPWVAVFISSGVFALGHAYQDTAGVITAFYFAILMGSLYFYFKQNVWYLICIHAIYDTIGLYKLYSGG